MINPCLFIAETDEKGRGVFTTGKIPKETVIEVAPVIVLSGKDRVHLDQTLLHDYIFEWGDLKDKCCMALGFVPLYNHSYEANCDYEMDYESKLIRIKTMRDIDAEEELTINYNGIWNNQKKVWFDKR